MSTEAIINKIPDVYFDWYARFLPGSIGVVGYFYFSTSKPEISTSFLFLYVFLAYLTGHIIQPIAGYTVKKIEHLLSSLSGPINIEQHFSDAKKKDANKDIIGKAGKAHAEANSMMSSAFILLILMIKYQNSEMISVLLCGYFFIMTVERIFARKRKILELD